MHSKKNHQHYVILLNIKNKRIANLIAIITFTLLLAFTFNSNEKEDKDSEIIKYQQDNLTIVSAYYKIKSKRRPRQYKDWLKNFIILNKSIVFFTNKKLIPKIKKMRPKELYNKTVFLSIEMEEFYSYKNYYSEFKEAFLIDTEKRYHSVPLYLVWAEKCNFLKKVVLNNYFNSTCFYWIDAGYFRKKSEIQKYSNNWPSTNKCYEDQRILMGQVFFFSNEEKEKILNFDIQAHMRLQKNHNVIGGIFGGQKENILKFIDYYYKTIRLFLNKKIFIGKDQNIFTFIAFAHPEIVKLIMCKNYFDYREQIS